MSKNISNYVRKDKRTNKMILISPVIYKELQKVADNVTDTYFLAIGRLSHVLFF